MQSDRALNDFMNTFNHVHLHNYFTWMLIVYPFFVAYFHIIDMDTVFLLQLLERYYVHPCFLLTCVGRS